MGEGSPSADTKGKPVLRWLKIYGASLGTLLRVLMSNPFLRFKINEPLLGLREKAYDEERDDRQGGGNGFP